MVSFTSKNFFYLQKKFVMVVSVRFIQMTKKSGETSRHTTRRVREPNGKEGQMKETKKKGRREKGKGK